jgi:hypothetical protein
LFKRIIIALLVSIILMVIGGSAVWATDPPALTTDVLQVWQNSTTTEMGNNLTYIDLNLVTAGSKPGWCVAQNFKIHPNIDYPATLYDYFGRYAQDSSGFPASIQDRIHDTDWHAIAWILNNKIGTPGTTQLSNDVQTAIWHFTDGFNPTNSNALAMIGQANANPNFTPNAQQVRPIVCYIGTFQNVYVQDIFFEYTGGIPAFPVPEVPAVALLGLGIAGIGTFVIIKRKKANSPTAP